MVQGKKNIRSTAFLKQGAVNSVVNHSLSLAEVTVKYKISLYCLESWLRKYRHGGYEELLVTKPTGRSTKMPKKKKVKGMIELERLQEENAEMFGIGPRPSED